MMVFIIYISVFVLSAALIRKQSDRQFIFGVVDQPNSRSSHSQATPSAGGLSIIIMYFFGLFLLHLSNLVILKDLVIFLVCASVIGTVGYLDDVFGVRPSVRLIFQFMSALAVLVTINGLNVLEFSLFDYRVVLLLILSLVSFVWLINLFNFMDGIDGYAASQTIFVSVLSSTLLLVCSDAPTREILSHFTLPLFMLATVMLAFILFNWPKASLFMGDTGSGFLGFILGCFMISSVTKQLISIETWMVIIALFVVDSSLALVRRGLNGEKVYEAHRSHAYQNLSRKYSSHLTVTVLGIAVNVCFIAPAAFFSHMLPDLSIYILVGVYVVLTCSCYIFGSGVTGLYESEV